MRLEKDLQAYIVKMAKGHGMLVYKFASPSNRGVPDLILFGKPGVTWLIEVKSPSGTGKLTELQARNILKLEMCQIPVSVVASKEEADSLMLTILDVIYECEVANDN